MKFKLHTKAAFPLLVLFSFLAALLISMILFSAISFQENESSSGSGSILETERDYLKLDNKIGVTRSVIYPNNLFPPSLIRWTENIENISYNGSVSLIYFLYDRAENTTTATYKGILYPQ